jgi:predicted nucleotidyltransferase
MTASALRKILDDTKAIQIRLLESLMAEFISSRYVQEIYIRGSIASGKFDRSSDIDLVIIVDDDHYQGLLAQQCHEELRGICGELCLSLRIY